YEVDDGQILIDGTDINDLKIEKYHSQIGVVLQENFLFAGTIYNNLKFAKPDATEEEIIRAAKMANAHDFILKTPDGYNTYVGEHGFNISGGERQRLAIARAILNNPKILILDEATSALDTESEYLIQKALERLTANCTTFAIAHRLSTLKDADRLVVIDGHHIAEVGTHNELMEKKGIYYGLVTAQLQMQALKGEEAENGESTEDAEASENTEDNGGSAEAPAAPALA
ncbi:MAG: ATP-binding cassette domain-containing protein, partial [Lachnospiraceae bacterium]|nr:ATP-binding cassette domain-containing protein [Lachnospiraceae bacterium]